MSEIDLQFLLETGFEEYSSGEHLSSYRHVLGWNLFLEGSLSRGWSGELQVDPWSIRTWEAHFVWPEIKTRQDVLDVIRLFKK